MTCVEISQAIALHLAEWMDWYLYLMLKKEGIDVEWKFRVDYKELVGMGIILLLWEMIGNCEF